MKVGGALGLVTLALVVLAAAGCSDTARVSVAPSCSSSSSSVTTTPPSSAESELTAADRAMLYEIRALHEDWRTGKIEIDWPPADVDSAGEFGASDLEEIFQVMEEAVFSPEVVVFLYDETGTAPELQAEIVGWPEVASVRFVSKDEALARLREDLEDNPEVLQALEGNPLPNSIEIRVNGTGSAPIVGERLEGRPEVDEVRWASDSGYPFGRLLALLKSLARPSTP